jgi:hypothetical protein
MSPEQAAGQLATPAADWYAVGVVLFEALTGRYPFGGSVMEMLLAKQCEDAPRASSLAPHVSRELDELIAGLLRRVPSERPGITEVLAWCSGARQGAARPAPARASSGLVERDVQLAALHQALDRVLVGRPTCVDVIGDAGTGKTALVRQFLGELPAARVNVLESACSQRESVPYRAFDGLVDAIAGLLVRIPGRECEAIVHDIGGPLHALAQIFPVLARVPWIAAQAPRDLPEPQEMRRRAFLGLKLLLFRIAERRPTVVVFDNLQWGDRDSARLLENLLAQPGVPPCLFVLAFRLDERSPMLRELVLLREMMTPAYSLLRVDTPPLSPAAATQLAAQLQSGPASPRRTRLSRRIAEESGGNPALIHALVDEAVVPGGDAELTLSGGGELLPRLVRGRLAQLGPEAHETLGRIVASATPLSPAELLRGATRQGDVLAAVAQLRARGLVRVDGEGDALRFAPVNEPIQRAALAALDPVVLRRCHRDLAAALVAAGADEPERLARHLHAAGLVDEALEHATSAAYQAAKALAFDRAAELYQLALECRPGLWSLQKSCAEALVQAGRGAEAGPLFFAAAETAPANAVARLRRQAAGQFLDYGDLERGLQILHPLLHEAGLEPAGAPREIAAQVVANTERLLQRGLALVERSEFELARRDLDRIDLCWTAGKGLLINEPTQASLFLTRAALMALEAGEPRRAARCLTLCGLALRSRGVTDGAAMLAAAEPIAERIRDHYAIGLATICRGILARLEGQWLAALASLDAGIEHLREHCPGTVWEAGLGQASTMVALESLGELRTLGERTEALLRHAQEVGDSHTGLLAAIYSALTLLAAGHPKDARARVRSALTHWPRQGFHVQHLHALKIGIYCDLHERRPEDAWRRLLGTWPLLEQSNLLAVASRRAEALILRARAALAALRARPAEYGHLSELVGQDIAQLERERKRFAPECALFRAGLAACAADPVAMTRHLNVALGGFEHSGMNLSAVAIRRLLTRDAGPPAVFAQTEALLRMQNVGDIDGWLRVVAPGVAT